VLENKLSICIYEIEKRNPSIYILIKIADYFDVSLGYLRGITDVKPFIKNYITLGAV